MPTLYHYTASGCVQSIVRAGFLFPAANFLDPETLSRQAPWLRENLGLVWLTDLDVPHRDALGLTNIAIRADRTEARFRVTDDVGAVPWVRFRRSASPALRGALESAAGAMPSHWWVATGPVAVALDPVVAS